jgi:hypothetical protein
MVTAIRAVIAELSAFGCRPVRAIFEAEAPPSAYHKLVCRKVHSLLFDRRAGVAARRHDGCILVVSGIGVRVGLGKFRGRITKNRARFSIRLPLGETRCNRAATQLGFFRAPAGSRLLELRILSKFNECFVTTTG